MLGQDTFHYKGLPDSQDDKMALESKMALRSISRLEVTSPNKCHSFFSSRTIVLVAQQSADHLLNCNRIFYNVLGILSVDGSLSGARQSFCSFI